jgi:hypothetical protein
VRLVAYNLRLYYSFLTVLMLTIRYVVDSYPLLHCVAAFIEPVISYLAAAVGLWVCCESVVSVMFLWKRDTHTHTRAHAHTHHGNFMLVNLPLFSWKEDKIIQGSRVKFRIMHLNVRILSKKHVTGELLYMRPYCIAVLKATSHSSATEQFHLYY